MIKAKHNHFWMLLFLWYNKQTIKQQFLSSFNNIIITTLYFFPIYALQVKFHYSNFSWITKLIVLVNSPLEITLRILYSFQFITKTLGFQKWKPAPEIWVKRNTYTILSSNKNRAHYVVWYSLFLNFMCKITELSRNGYFSPLYSNKGSNKIGKVLSISVYSS